MKIFLPSVQKEEEVVSGQSFEDALYDIIVTSPHQQRKQYKKHPLLMQAATIKAEDMRDLDYFDHVSPTGRTSNEIIRELGYVLPDYYPKKGYNCESICIGGLTAQAIADAWYASKDHRVHVYGQLDFFHDQECIGVGLSKTKSGRILAVFLSAPCMD